MVAALAGEQQPPGIPVAHNGDAVRARRKLVSSMPTTSTPSTLSNARDREARSWKRPRHAELGGLAAHAALAALAAGHARHVGVQPGLELEAVQVTPGAAQPVVHGLRGCTAGGTAQQRARAADLEVDALGWHTSLTSSTTHGGCWPNAPVNSASTPTLKPVLLAAARWLVDRLKGSLPKWPPGSTTTIDSGCWVQHETTRGRPGARGGTRGKRGQRRASTKPASASRETPRRSASRRRSTALRRDSFCITDARCFSTVFGLSRMRSAAARFV